MNRIFKNRLSKLLTIRNSLKSLTGVSILMVFLGNLAHSERLEHHSAQNLVIDLSHAEEPNRWFVVNDGVMGGLSNSSFKPYQQTARFSGRISLDNNGGFSSVYRRLKNFNQAYSKVSIDIVGDGQSYQLRTASNIQGYRVAYKHEFDTIQGQRQTIEFLLDDFKASFRGRLIPNAPLLTETEIREIGFLMTKKRAGEFSLQVNSIVFSL
jgi:hypothetical protein